jgi:hypothetical protein
VGSTEVDGKVTRHVIPQTGGGQTTSLAMVSFAAGAIWPLLVVGLVELGSIIVYANVQPKPASNVGILALVARDA